MERGVPAPREVVRNRTFLFPCFGKRPFVPSCGNPCADHVRTAHCRLPERVRPACHVRLLLCCPPPVPDQGAETRVVRMQGVSPERGPFLALGRTRSTDWKFVLFCFIPMEIACKLEPYVWFLCPVSMASGGQTRRSADPLISEALCLRARPHADPAPVSAHFRCWDGAR